MKYFLIFLGVMFAFSFTLLISRNPYSVLSGEMIGLACIITVIYLLTKSHSSDNKDDSANQILTPSHHHLPEDDVTSDNHSMTGVKDR